MSPDTLIHLIEQYRYWVLFPLAVFEGPVVSFVVGTLVALGYFDPYIALGVLILGDLIPDTGYYFLGRWGAGTALAKKYMAKLGSMEIVRRLWHEHGGKTMFFSKLAYGLSTAFLVSAGLVQMPLRRFLRYALPITIIQYSALMFLGYHFGNSFGTVTNILDHIQIVIAAVIIVAIGYYFLTRYMRTRLLKEEEEEEKAMRKGR